MKFELSNHVALQHPDWRDSDQYYIPRAFIGKGADDTETLCRPLSGGE